MNKIFKRADESARAETSSYSGPVCPYCHMTYTPLLDHIYVIKKGLDIAIADVVKCGRCGEKINVKLLLPPQLDKPEIAKFIKTHLGNKFWYEHELQLQKRDENLLPKEGEDISHFSRRLKYYLEDLKRTEEKGDGGKRI